jgi:formylglycine-generating enzyme required for sulfatase activity
MMRRTVAVTAALLLLSASQPTPAKRPSAPLVDPATMVDLPGGLFAMGIELTPPSPYGDAWFIDQTPEHSVTLSPFSIDQHEASVAEYADFLRFAGGEAHYHRTQPIEQIDGAFLAKRGEERRPMRRVRLADAKAYCRWAGKRLPTEAEFEFAASNGGTTDVPYDTSTPQSGCSRANYFTGSVPCYGAVLPVDSLPTGRSQAGIFHLAGNVAEWTSDRYGDYSSEPQNDPTGNTFAPLFVTRGGGHLDGGQFLRARARRPAHPDNRSDNLGFRCVLAGPPPSEGWRGPLDPPTANLLERRAPAANPPPRPEVLAEGLIFPQVITAFGTGYAVSERGRSQITLVHDGELTTLAEGVVADTMAAAGNLLIVAVREEDRVIGLSGAGEQAFDHPLPADYLTAHADQVLVAAGADLFTFSTTGDDPQPIPWDGAPIAGLSAANGVFFGIDNQGLSFTVRGHDITTAGRASWAFGGTIRQLAVHDDKPWVLVRHTRWPDWGALCRVPDGGGSLICPTYSPPKPAHFGFVGDQLVWATQFTISTAPTSGGAPLTHPVAQTRAGGLALGDGFAVWTDEHLGRVLRVAIP